MYADLRILSLVSRKVDGTERSGRGTAPSAAGGFGGADTALTRLARPFVPKPFRSNGGMSTSADTMMSIGMGRHNNDDELPDDQINIASIVDRKVSDRRYLPRKLGNMKKYLHTTPISEALDSDDDSIHRTMALYEDSIADYIGSIANKGMSKIKSFISGDAESNDDADVGTIEKIGYTVAPFIPLGGEIWYGVHAIRDFNAIENLAAELEDMLKQNGIEISMTAAPEDNNDALMHLKIPSPADRANIRAATINIAMKCYDFLSDAISALPLDLIPGLSMADVVIDSSLTAAAGAAPVIDPEGEKFARALFNFSMKYGEKLKQLESGLAGIAQNIPGIGEEKIKEMHAISNFIGNLAMVNAAVSDAMSDIENSEDPDILAERRRRKKKVRTDEFSSVGAVAGYTGPMKGPKSPKAFYDTMARVAGSQYFVDPLKAIKPKP
jgi:hypothetical protein